MGFCAAVAEKLQATTKRLQPSLIFLLSAQAGFFLTNLWLALRAFSWGDDAVDDIDDWYQKVHQFRVQKAASYVSNHHISA